MQTCAGSLLQRGLMTCDGCVKSAPRRDSDYLVFKQVCPDSLGCLYLYSFNGLHEQFYSRFLLPNFLKTVSIIISPLVPINLLIYISTVRSMSNLRSYKQAFPTSQTYRQNNVQNKRQFCLLWLIFTPGSIWIFMIQSPSKAG